MKLTTAAKANNALNNLILDFPSSIDRRTNGRIAVKSVHFAPDLVCVETIAYPTSQEIKAKWYSRKDEKRFRSILLRDAVVYSNKIVESAGNPRYGKVYEELVIRCVGLHHLISRDVFGTCQALKHSKKEHTGAVLEAQLIHGHRSEESIEILACVSEASSAWSNYRARMAAKLGATIM